MRPFHSIQNLSSKLAFGLYTTIWPDRWETNRFRRSALIQQSFFYDLSPDDQEQYIITALRVLVNYCRREVPYYDTLLKGLPSNFPGSLEEYRQVPPLNKKNIRLSGDALLSQQYPQQNLIKYSTGGSTGEPISVFITKADQGIGEASNELFMRKVGGRAGNRIGTLYGGDLDISVTPSLERRIKNWFWNYSEHGCFRLDEQYLLEFHAVMRRFQPDVLLGYSSAIYLLALTLNAKGIRPDYPRFSVLTAAEKLEDKQRTLIEKVFQVPVVERYGSRDAGLLAYQHPGDRRFWIDRWAYLLEPEEKPDDKGQASLLITRLQVKGMPLLRYRIEDLATFPSDWSPRHSAKWLEEINGRILDIIHLPEGRMVHGSEFPHLFKDFDILLYQVVQDADGKVLISIVPTPAFDKRQQDRCEQIIQSNLAGIPVTFCYKKEITRSAQQKLRPVISYYSSKQPPNFSPV